MSYIFLGPTLSVTEAREVLDAHYLPPAQLGDILTLVREKKPKAIGLIDGYFSHTLPVWHKEILYALEQKVAVFGSSSMGALRAAETDQFGMVGIGKVYEMFRTGELTDDDEVALMHGSEESHFLNFSLPMVNIRITLQEAIKKGLISVELGQKWIESAKQLYYPQRTLDEIVHSAHLAKEEERLFRHIFADHYMDQKKEDALSLLRRMAQETIPPPILREPMHQTPLFEQLFYQDRSIFVEETKISLRDLAKYIALHHPTFSQLRVHALNRLLVGVLAKIVEIEVEPADIEKEKERFLMQHDLFIPSSLESWLEENHLNVTEFEELIVQQAQAQKLYASPLASGFGWRMQKAFLDELKLNNQYSEWAKKATTHQESWQKSTPFYSEGKHEEIFDNEIFADHIQNSEWDLEVSVKQWCEEAGFHNLQELVLELHKAKLARNEHLCR